MLVDSLVFRPLAPDLEGFLPPAELLQRVIHRFPHAVLDRHRGNQWIQAAADEMVSLGLPATDTLVVNHRALAGEVTHVTIREQPAGPHFGFYLFPHPTVIELEFDTPADRERCRALLQDLAAILPEYDLKEDDLLD